MFVAAIAIFVCLLSAFLFAIFIHFFPSSLMLLKQWILYQFKTRAELVGKIENRQDVDYFVLSMSGRVACRDAHIQVEMFDVTSGMRQPLRILCVDPNMHKGTSAEFLYQSYHNEICPNDTGSSQWDTVMELSCAVLRFPHRGHRMLQFVTCITDTSSGRKLAESRTRLKYFVSVAEGYLDFFNRQERILTAGRIVAGQTAGGAMTPDQQELLDQWLEHNKVIQKAQTVPIDRKLFAGKDAKDILQKACHVLMTQSDAAFQNELMVLCLQIAEAAKPVERDKQKWLRELAGKLHIAPERFREIYQKYLPLTAQKDPDPALVLGIDDSLSSDELVDRLTEEYHKWNSRVNHPNPQIRKQADEMLAYLAQVRERLSVNAQ